MRGQFARVPLEPGGLHALDCVQKRGSANRQGLVGESEVPMSSMPTILSDVLVRRVLQDQQRKLMLTGQAGRVWSDAVAVVLGTLS